MSHGCLALRQQRSSERRSAVVEESAVEVASAFAAPAPARPAVSDVLERASSE